MMAPQARWWYDAIHVFAGSILSAISMLQWWFPARCRVDGVVEDGGDDI